jgi:DNA invertase Pin-like site-specific DNA recombinase
MLLDVLATTARKDDGATKGSAWWERPDTIQEVAQESRDSKLSDRYGACGAARAYLGVSTDEEDAARAGAAVESFAAENGLNIVGTYVEGEAGAKVERPELFRLIADSRPRDVLLIEQADRLSRLTAADWQKLRSGLDTKPLRIIALDLPASSYALGAVDRIMCHMFNDMMLDVLAAIARKNH